MNKRKYRENSQNTYLVDHDDHIEHPLCLCEYYNNKNERSHLLMCCCNCEALDNLCTSFICCCCQEDDDDSKDSFMYNRLRTFKQVLNDIHDRARLPFPGGARKLNFDFFLTVLSLYLFVQIGTLNIICTFMSIFIVPMLIYPRFFLMRRSISDKSHQTVKIGYYLILNSLIFNLFIINFNLFENLTKLDYYFLNILLVGALAFLVYMKNSDPGVLKTNVIPSAINEDYCKSCLVKKDYRTDRIGHCPQCSQCIYKRDHHCFWIDNCVGYLNHRKFIVFLVYLLFLFVCSFCVFKKYLNSIECKFPFECLTNEFYYRSFSNSYITLMMVQLVPLISYLNLLLIQQMLFICIGHTQYQLYRLSKKNIRFSLALFLGQNLNFKNSVRNLFDFVFKSRNRSDLEQNIFNSFQIV